MIILYRTHLGNGVSKTKLFSSSQYLQAWSHNSSWLSRGLSISIAPHSLQRPFASQSFEFLADSNSWRTSSNLPLISAPFSTSHFLILLTKSSLLGYSDAPGQYNESFEIGNPIRSKCILIWCVLPVRGLQTTTLSSVSGIYLKGKKRVVASLEGCNPAGKPLFGSILYIGDSCTIAASLSKFTGWVTPTKFGVQCGNLPLTLARYNLFILLDEIFVWIFDAIWLSLDKIRRPEVTLSSR